MISQYMLAGLRSFAQRMLSGHCYIYDGTTSADAGGVQINNSQNLPLRAGNTYPVKCSMQLIPRNPVQPVVGEGLYSIGEYNLGLPIGTLVQEQDTVVVVSNEGIQTRLHVATIANGIDSTMLMWLHCQKRE